ncbi:hypothetical protein BD779DRAFT_1475968 [Infundibulicybe gibba]|nr:hypothetical protein BD779DRAFT_1475968 [Infundibulicybe gibba]
MGARRAAEVYGPRAHAEAPHEGAVCGGNAVRRCGYRGEGGLVPGAGFRSHSAALEAGPGGREVMAWGRSMSQIRASYSGAYHFHYVPRCNSFVRGCDAVVGYGHGGAVHPEVAIESEWGIHRSQRGAEERLEPSMKAEDQLVRLWDRTRCANLISPTGLGFLSDVEMGVEY